ncbi:MAG: HDOD domain-containing protein [Proteobacteria bacterium]|nr:HDOD domain-containing protein [Pseudomonadota bacterium]MBU1386511.1 HDOD domain-containing protein [Pseudomonadota bacterium]MBU1544622.1 HDOD domain-containing protein [Pseudomonadota bacterium]MBU2429777.1 HDOD domain-containing protein [Pseudomonadota bacterium]MBU2481399.1 HDOD domain-containing protein [Pseudomonadota bacterium]
MKKRILFVDDEVNILKGLKRSLRPVRDLWDMEFVQSGKDALDLLEKQAFDVIVSDMRMPEMDGAALLKTVRKKYPMMVRMILSGYSDQEMVMKSVKSAHQYLSKPCETQALISAITRACSLCDFLNQEALQTLLGGMASVPSLPTVYLQIIEELNSPGACAKNVARIIAKDMGMTAKVLQLVNSSFFGMKDHVSDIADAVAFLGMDVIKTLVLSLEIFSRLSQDALSVICVDEMYQHCMKTGAIAKFIATTEKLDKKIVENVIIACVLHDIGKLILCQYYTDDYKTVSALVADENISFFKAERQIFGVSHAQVGAYLLGLWGLPVDIVEGIAFHHEPSRSGSHEFELCGIIHIADRLERNEYSPQNSIETIVGLDIPYFDKLGLSARIPLWQEGIAKI